MTLRVLWALVLCTRLFLCLGQQPVPNSCLGVNLSIPNDFHKVYCTDGVVLLKHNTAEVWVQVIDQGNGARVTFKHGALSAQAGTGVFGGPINRAEGRLVYTEAGVPPPATFWSDFIAAEDDHFSMVNGTFWNCTGFGCESYYGSAGFSYPYKTGGSVISGGESLDFGGVHANLCYLQFNNSQEGLGFGQFTAGVQPYPDIMSPAWKDNLIIGKRPPFGDDTCNRPKTYIGVKGQLIYIMTTDQQSYTAADAYMLQFVDSYDNYMIMDGGGSTKLVARVALDETDDFTCDITPLCGTNALDCTREVPQVVAVSSAAIELRMNTSIEGIPATVTAGTSQSAYVYVKNDRTTSWNGTIRFQLYDGSPQGVTLYETQKQINGSTEVLVPAQFAVPCLPSGTYPVLLQYRTTGKDHYYLVEDHFFVSGDLSDVSYDNSINLIVSNTLPLPTASAGANQTIPIGGSATLAGSGGSTYSWSPSASLSNPNIWNPIASPTVTTTYTLTVTNANGCTDIDQVTITVTGTGGGGTPANDDPCNAIALNVGSSCSYITGSNLNATGSSIPTPSTCAASSTSSNPSGNYQGGDIWYSAVVPSSGQLIVQTQIQSSITDLAMVAYTGTNCSSLTQLACSDDQVPGSNYMPRLSLTGLTPGQTIRFRVYEFGNNTFGNFGICASSPSGGSNAGRDLTTSITSVSDITVQQGDHIVVTYKVKNIGTLDVTTPFLAALYLSPDPSYSSGSDVLVDGSIVAFLSLNAGQEYTATTTITIPNEPDGSYYLISYADVASAVGETSESNNYGYSAIQLGNLVPNGPNLEVADVDVIPNTGVAPGQVVDVVVRLENSGTTHAHDCHVLVVFDLNDNHHYDPGTDPVLENIYFPDLYAGDDDTRTRDVVLPANISAIGGYDIIAVADINNECNETNELDQEESDEVQITTLTPAGPDLVPSLNHIELPPPSNDQVSSQNLCVTNGYDIFFDVTNIGNLNSPGNLGNVYTRVYISTDPVISGNDYIWTVKFHSSGSWNIGQVRAYRDDDTFEGMAPGPAYMIISTDEGHVLTEANEANNIVAYPIYITSCGEVLPDLTGSINFYAPFSSTLGSPIEAELTITNQGTAVAPPHRVGLYISDDQQFDGDGGNGINDNQLENVGYVNISTPLQPGESVTTEVSGTSQGLTSTGAKFLIMAVDDGTDINELDRTNNNIAVPIEITSISCYYNHEWLELSSGSVDYHALSSFPLYINTEESCGWSITEAVSWASGASNQQFGDGPYFLNIQENPYPVSRSLSLQLNGAPLVDIVQGARPCALVDPSLLPSIATTTTPATCNLANGAIIATATGAYPPFQYAWSNSATTGSIGGLSSGSYNLTVTDAVGCSSSTAVSIASSTTSGCTPVQIHVNLEGPWNGADMNDALRSAGYLPTTEPYGAMGWHVGFGGGETVAASRLSITGDSAVVDWVLVQLRNGSNPNQILETRSGLLLRNGAVISASGSRPLVFGYASGSYNLAVRHRNHLGVMTASAIPFTGVSVVVDFRSLATSTWGTNAQKTIGSVRAMWLGNTSGDAAIKYTGASNDRDPILVKVGGTTPNNTVNGYWREDVNLDGAVKYTGANNDRDPILLNVGSTTPNAVRTEQLP